MTIEIRKRILSEGTHIDDGEILISKSRYTIYVIVENGKRIDSFLKYQNALKKVRELRRQK